SPSLTGSARGRSFNAARIPSAKDCGVERSAARGGDRPQRPASRRDQVQLRGLSRAHARSVRGARGRSAARRRRQGRRVTGVRSKEHYSYSAYADPGMAQSFDRRRFGGPIGEYVAGSQARVLANMVGRIQDRSIVDVGTGTGRAAILMARGGARVTAVDASEQMLEVARRRAAEEQLGIRFMRGDAHALQ